MKNKLLDHLNKAQKLVVTTTEGTVLALAGAGSGKTRSIIHRAAYLMQEKRVRPTNILIVTFTNKAARELKDRLENLFGISPDRIWVGTFHSICARILRFEVDHIPHKANFSIYDQTDQKSVMKKIFKAHDIDTKTFPIGKVQNIISKMKSNLVLPNDFFDFQEENHFTKTVYKIYEDYQKILVANNAMDFDDMILYTAKLLHENDFVRKKYERQFKYIMIDEYQDTNFAQFKLVNLLAKTHQNLCVVGDDDQAIYSWRGANIENILKFEKDYKDVTTIRLEQNYRSTPTILNLANSLIHKNSNRHEKKLWSDNPDGKLPTLSALDNEHDEAGFVFREIKALRKENHSYNEMVVLYRTNAQSRAFEMLFQQEGVPYTIVGGVNFLQRKEVKDIVSVLRMLANDTDDEAMIRVLQLYPGIGKTTINKVIDYKINQNKTLFQVLINCDDLPTIKGAARKKLFNFSTQLSQWKTHSKTLSIDLLTKHILDDFNWIENYKYSKDPKDVSRAENLEEFLNSTVEFTEKYESEEEEKALLEVYLQNLSLQTDLDYQEDGESVKLMTMHNAKGLEFESVFAVGLEDGLLPHQLSLDSETSLEEERRLLYVAVTRAKRNLYLSYARWRRSFDGNHPTIMSRFLQDFDQNYYEQDTNHFYEMQSPVRAKPTKTQTRKKKAGIILETEKLYKIGQQVKHKTFGQGVILNVDGKGADAKLTISFSSGNLKKIVGTFVELV